MDVIEVENGHDIVVMTERVVIVSIRHEFKKEEICENYLSSLLNKNKSLETV